MNILYQDKVIDYINKFTLETFPHTVLIRGEKGSGKHLICSYVAEKFGLELVDITNNLTLEFINEIYLSPTPRFYLINSDEISIKEQNVILKFLEEPNNTIYILLTNSNSLLLDTIKNRCLEIEMARYTKNQLKTFLDKENELILKISSTPGDVLHFQEVSFDNMYDFCNKIFNHIKTANLSNCLTISNNLYFTDKEVDESKYDVVLICKVMLYISKYLSYEVYLLTKELCETINIPNINKRILFDKYIVQLKYCI